MTDKTSSNWKMADVSGKQVTRRVAVAGGRIRLGEEAFTLLIEGRLPKGDPLAMAEIAAIQAAKQTPALLPLCHPISLNRVALHSVLRPDDHAVELFHPEVQVLKTAPNAVKRGESITFEFWSVAGGGTLIDTYTLTNDTSNFICEDFESGFTLTQPVGNHADWYDGGSGPIVTSGNGVVSSIGLAPASAIFTWSGCRR